MTKISARDQLLHVFHVANAAIHLLDALNDQFWCSRTFYEDYPGYKDMALRVEKLREDAKDLAEYAYLRTLPIDNKVKP